MRLIDADKYKWEIENACGCDAPVQKDMIRFCSGVVDNMPTIDPVDHYYDWHDLRKNPEDLPTEDGYYLCKVGSTAFYPYRVMEYAPFDLRIDGENKWKCAGIYVYDHFVLAWRYIEPSEEVE